MLIKRIFLLCLLFSILFPSLGMAATYYVDATDGDDTKDGLSEANAWKTIAKVNSSSFNAGDSILFQKGEIWRLENLTVDFSGTEGNEVTVGAYGSGADPIITGTELVTGWTVDSGSRYKASRATATYAILLDGEHPAGGQYLPEANAAAVTEDNEWYWDDGDDLLYLYSSGGDPNDVWQSPGVEAMVNDYGIWLYQCSWIIVEDFDVYGCERSALLYDGCSNVIVQDCELHHGGQYNTQPDATESHVVVFQGNADGNTLRRSKVHHGRLHGVFWYHGDNNVIEDCEVYDNIYSNLDHQSTGGTATGNTIRYNKIYFSSSHTVDAAQSVSGNQIFMEGADCDNLYIYANVIFDNDPNIDHPVIHQDSGTDPDNIYIYNNTTVGDWAVYSSNQVTIKNNIGYFKSGSSASVLIRYSAGTGNKTVDGNCWYRASGNLISTNGTTYTVAQWNTYVSATGFDTNGQYADPLFRDEANDDYALAPDSPCRTTGEDLGTGLYYTVLPSSKWTDSVVPANPDGYGQWPQGCYQDVSFTVTVGGGSETVTVGGGSQTITVQ